MEVRTMTQWNEALAAYEAECDVIESIRDEFGAFLKSCFDPLGKAVASRLGNEWTGKLANRGPRKEWTAQPRKVGLYAWYPRVWGGTAGKLVVAVYLDVREGFSQKDGALRRALFLRAAQQELGTIARSRARPADGRRAVRWHRPHRARPDRRERGDGA
jgi:hypothetical protein